MVLKIMLVLIIMLVPVTYKEEAVLPNYTYTAKEIDSVFKELVIEDKKDIVIKTYSGPMTAYGPDCRGCSGITASGYNVSKGNIYYNDKEYGQVRILAADRSIPFGTIIRISGLDISDEPVLAIVLDRGSAIGFNKKSYFDLLYKSEKATLSFGRKNATYDVLRNGYSVK